LQRQGVIRRPIPDCAKPFTLISTSPPTAIHFVGLDAGGFRVLFVEREM
jgi:hypothetical protein